MNVKVLFCGFLIFNFFTLISCGNKNPTPSNELPPLKTAHELWQRIKPLDFSKRDQAVAAMNILQPTLALPESQKIPLVRELALIHENSIGILNKILRAKPQEIDLFADFIMVVIDDLPDSASKKAWLETSNGSIDLLSRLLTGPDVFNTTRLKTLIDKMSEIAPSTKNALENMWFVIKNINFAKRGQLDWSKDLRHIDVSWEGNQQELDSYAFEVLMNLTRLPAHSMRRELSQMA